MSNMGTWAVSPFGLQLMTTNQSDSLNASLKRHTGWKESRIDEMVLSLLTLSESFDSRIVRSQYGSGDDYLIRRHLRTQYDINDPRAVIPQRDTTEEIRKRMEKVRAEDMYTVILCKIYFNKRLIIV